MYTKESLNLAGRFEPLHSSLSHPGRFMRLLCPIIRVPSCAMDSIRHQLTMCHTVASQLVRHDLSWLATITPYKLFKEALCGCSISASLQINSYHFSILINSGPQIFLLTIDLYENLINVERVSISSLPVPQSFGIFGPKLDTP